MPGVNGPNEAGVPSVSASVAGTVPPTGASAGASAAWTTTLSTTEPTGWAEVAPLSGPHHDTLPRSTAAFGAAQVPLRMFWTTRASLRTSTLTYVRTCSWFSTEFA